MFATSVGLVIKGFQEVTGIGRSAFWLSTADGSGSLEVEADDSHVIIVGVYSVPGGKGLDGAKALANKVLEGALGN